MGERRTGVALATSSCSIASLVHGYDGSSQSQTSASRHNPVDEWPGDLSKTSTAADHDAPYRLGFRRAHDKEEELQFVGGGAGSIEDGAQPMATEARLAGQRRYALRTLRARRAGSLGHPNPTERNTEDEEASLADLGGRLPWPIDSCLSHAGYRSEHDLLKLFDFTDTVTTSLDAAVPPYGMYHETADSDSSGWFGPLWMDPVSLDTSGTSYDLTLGPTLVPEITGISEHSRYACNECPKTFADKRGYMRHVQTMHGGVHYTCARCSRRFTRRDNLRRHQVKHHSDEAMELGLAWKGMITTNRSPKTHPRDHPWTAPQTQFSKITFGALPPEHVRLATIERGRDQDMSVQLDFVPISQLCRQDYIFISYCESGTIADKPLLQVLAPEAERAGARKFYTDEFPEMWLDKECYAAISELVPENGRSAFWVDAICINQADAKERASQLSRRSTILAGAQSVIWLGDADPKLHRAFEDLESVLSGRADPAAVEESILYLLSHRWFERIWSVQELASAKAITIKYGKHNADWENMRDGILHFADDYLSRTELEEIELARVVRARHTVGSTLAEQLARWKRRDVLEYWTRAFAGYTAQDPRDICFALYSTVLSDLQSPRDIFGVPLPAIDYTLDLLQVYKSFVAWTIQESKSIDIICQRWAAMVPVEFSPGKRLPHELPSWIQTVYGSGEGRPGGWASLKDSFVCLADRLRYAASAHTEACAKLVQHDDTEQPLSTASPRISGLYSLALQTSGILLGRIQNTIGPITNGVLPAVVVNKLSQAHPDVRYLEDVLVAERGEDGQLPSPLTSRAFDAILGSRKANDHVDVKELLRRTRIPYVRSVLRRMQTVIWDRCFLEVKPTDGSVYQGFGPTNTCADDLVCILLGCSVPVVLRRLDEMRGDVYRLVGEAYIHGVMNGEAFKAHSAAMHGSVQKNFVIV